jgi:hypothetical protein
LNYKNDLQRESGGAGRRWREEGDSLGGRGRRGKKRKKTAEAEITLPLPLSLLYLLLFFALCPLPRTRTRTLERHRCPCALPLARARVRAAAGAKKRAREGERERRKRKSRRWKVRHAARRLLFSFLALLLPPSSPALLSLSFFALAETAPLMRRALDSAMFPWMRGRRKRERERKSGDEMVKDGFGKSVAVEWPFSPFFTSLSSPAHARVECLL